MHEHATPYPNPTTGAHDANTDDLGTEGSLVVEDHHFAIVPEWVITAQVSDAAFRLYSMLLRFGNTSGRRMPSRALLANQLHRSVDSIDRALRELSAAGIVRVEHRRNGRVNLSNRYHLRTTPPGTKGGSRKSAATPTDASARDRNGAPTPGRTCAATRGRNPAGGVAAQLRPNPKVSTQEQPPPHGPVTGDDTPAGPGRAVEVTDQALLAACGISDIDDLSRRCAAARRALGQPANRWAPQCLAVAIRMAVVNRGWPPADVVPALLAIAGDRTTRSPVRLAEAGPWWDTPPVTGNDDQGELADLEQRLVEVGGRRPALQAQARAELTREGAPLTRGTVTRRAIQILDLAQAPA